MDWHHSTASIANRLKRLQHTEYLNQYQLYLRVVGQDLLKPQKKKQRSIISMMPKRSGDPVLDRLVKARNEKSTVALRQKGIMTSSRIKKEMDVSFHSLLKEKDNHNIHGQQNVIKGLGRSKIVALINCDILSAHALLQADPLRYDGSEFLNYRLIPEWQGRVEAYYSKLNNQYAVAEAAYKEAEKQLAVANKVLFDYQNSDAARQAQRREQLRLSNPYGRDARRKSASATPLAEEETVDPNWKPPLFSKFVDKQGYCGKILSKYRVDSIVTTVFNHRKAFMEAKMMCLCASILKIDFNYKLASKIKVWTKQGQSFQPFKCLVTVQNEDGLTVFWKALKQSESFAEISQDLIRLRHRLNRNLAATKRRNNGGRSLEQAVKVVYVDNCCTVCNVTKSCFPGCLVKLDAFHWLKRWNETLRDPKSEQAGVFRALMSRALFCCGLDEFESARQRLEERGKTSLTTKEIMKEANTVIPAPALLRSNVEAVLAYCLAKDAAADPLIALRREDDDSPMPCTFFVNTTVAKNIIRKQMKHVDKGCLSDPPTDLVNIFRYNPVKKVCYVARGTNTNERDNLDLATRILTATHIGIHRADRLISSFFERKNTDKSVIRMGQEDQGTYETERLLMLNSYAASVGYDPVREVPFPNVRAPTISPTAPKEFMGFSYNRPTRKTTRRL
jgi:hypothetical protein